MILAVMIFSFYFFLIKPTKSADSWTESCVVSGSISCASSGACTLPFGSECRISDTCSVSCPTRANTVLDNTCGVVKSCGCIEGSCTGGGRCGSSGDCAYTCIEGWHNDDNVKSNGCENQAPHWYNASENNTNPSVGDAVEFSVNWTDVTGAANTGLGVSYTWFSWNASGANCDTWVNLSYTPQNNVNSTWFNLTQTISDVCIGKTIEKRIC